MNKRERALLEDLYAIIDGIPKDRISLSTLATNTNYGLVSPHTCGTVACALGWAAMHPKFKALGLGLITNNSSGYLTLNGREDEFEAVASELFGISWFEAQEVFGAREDFENGSDKKVFKQRVRKFLKEQDAHKS